jgi:hypothetical protein
LRHLAAATAVVGLAIAASGCAQSMSEFARNGTTASADPATIAPAGQQAAAPTTRPAVMVDETTVPMRQARSDAPMTIAPPAAELAAAEQPPTAAQPAMAGQPTAKVAPSAVNLNQVPEQPKSKLLTPDEKAKVIAELEALAKKQSATLSQDKKSADCAAQNLDPAARVASATGDGGC